MHTPHHLTWRRLLAAVAAVCVLFLAGCGPGVGGSGTGVTPEPLPSGAAPTSVCASDIAVLLDCGPGPGTSAPGSRPTGFVDTIDGRRVQLQIESSFATLEAPCAKLRFRGEWATVGSQTPRFYGLVEQDGASRSATLEAQVNGNTLQLTLRDGNGVLLLGPVLVTRGPISPVGSGC